MSERTKHPTFKHIVLYIRDHVVFTIYPDDYELKPTEMLMTKAIGYSKLEPEDIAIGLRDIIYKDVNFSAWMPSEYKVSDNSSNGLITQTFDVIENLNYHLGQIGNPDNFIIVKSYK